MEADAITSVDNMLQIWMWPQPGGWHQLNTYWGWSLVQTGGGAWGWSLL